MINKFVHSFREGPARIQLLSGWLKVLDCTIIMKMGLGKEKNSNVWDWLE